MQSPASAGRPLLDLHARPSTDFLKVIDDTLRRLDGQTLADGMIEAVEDDQSTCRRTGDRRHRHPQFATRLSVPSIDIGRSLLGCQPVHPAAVGNVANRPAAINIDRSLTTRAVIEENAGLKLLLIEKTEAFHSVKSMLDKSIKKNVALKTQNDRLQRSIASLLRQRFADSRRSTIAELDKPISLANDSITKHRNFADRVSMVPNAFKTMTDRGHRFDPDAFFDDFSKRSEIKSKTNIGHRVERVDTVAGFFRNFVGMKHEKHFKKSRLSKKEGRILLTLHNSRSHEDNQFLPRPASIQSNRPITAKGKSSSSVKSILRTETDLETKAVGRRGRRAKGLETAIMMIKRRKADAK